VSVLRNVNYGKPLETVELHKSVKKRSFYMYDKSTITLMSIGKYIYTVSNFNDFNCIITV